MAPAPPPLERPSLDPLLWRACAGVPVKIPAVGSLAYYFPQGHAEQSLWPLDLSLIAGAAPYVLARVIDVSYLVDDETQEVFARISLDPRSLSCGLPDVYKKEYSPEEEDGGVVSFAKILTPSDANNGGGFSVPKFCADTIFPLLNFAIDPPVQNLSVRDVDGSLYEFRHIYRGTPRRHLLTTGWSRFVDRKKLISRDSVVFIRNRVGQLFVGIRRASPKESGAPPKESRYGYANLENVTDAWRTTKGRVPPKSVVDAARKAQMKQPFEVLFYPGVGSPAFVVAAETVEAASRVNWASGMRVQMSTETEDSSKKTWFQGTVSATLPQDSGPWAPSPWRILQVIWDEPEVLHQASVCPWQVEFISLPIQPQTAFQPTKKPKVFIKPEFHSDGEDNVFLASTVLSTPEVGSSTLLSLSHNILPVGIQGARHGLTGVSSLPDSANFSCMLTRELHGINMQPKLIDVSTKLNLGSASQSESLSPPSQVSTLHQEKEASGGETLQLFGQIIDLQQHLDTDSNKEYNGHEGAVPSLNLSIFNMSIKFIMFMFIMFMLHVKDDLL